jgi:hypothetical protein
MYKRSENRASEAAGLARGWLAGSGSLVCCVRGRWRGAEGRVVERSVSCRQQRDAAEWWTAYR